MRDYSNATRGSVWVRLANALINQAKAERVTIINYSVGGSLASEWNTNPIRDARRQQISDALAAGLMPTHIVWFQGESEGPNGVSASTYQAEMTTLINDIRSQGVSAPFYNSTTTRNAGISYPTIQGAQAAIRSAAAGIFAGPDTDSLSDTYRFDGVHYTAAGLDLLASMWMTSLGW
jgi:lysophospholipase L1-like esterase